MRKLRRRQGGRGGGQGGPRAPKAGLGAGLQAGLAEVPVADPAGEADLRAAVCRAVAAAPTLKVPTTCQSESGTHSHNELLARPLLSGQGPASNVAAWGFSPWCTSKKETLKVTYLETSKYLKRLLEINF